MFNSQAEFDQLQRGIQLDVLPKIDFPWQVFFAELAKYSAIRPTLVESAVMFSFVGFFGIRCLSAVQTFQRMCGMCSMVHNESGLLAHCMYYVPSNIESGYITLHYLFKAHTKEN